jgi:hypothetical protein
VILESNSSLDTVEIVMMFEEIFGTDLPVNGAGNLGGTSEVVDWLEVHLSHNRPNEQAAALLTKLARTQQNPELAEGLQGSWRREQIAAIIRAILK